MPASPWGTHHGRLSLWHVSFFIVFRKNKYFIFSRFILEFTFSPWGPGSPWSPGIPWTPGTPWKRTFIFLRQKCRDRFVFSYHVPHRPFIQVQLRSSFLNNLSVETFKYRLNTFPGLEKTFTCSPGSPLLPWRQEKKMKETFVVVFSSLHMLLFFLLSVDVSPAVRPFLKFQGDPFVPVAPAAPQVQVSHQLQPFPQVQAVHVDQGDQDNL